MYVPAYIVPFPSRRGICQAITTLHDAILYYKHPYPTYATYVPSAIQILFAQHAAFSPSPALLYQRRTEPRPLVNVVVL